MSAKPQETFKQRVRAILDEPYWLDAIEPMTSYFRSHDDGDGDLGQGIEVTFYPGGDAWVATTIRRACRFRPFAGGGMSLRVRVALMVLAYAILLDNEAQAGTHSHADERLKPDHVYGTVRECEEVPVGTFQAQRIRVGDVIFRLPPSARNDWLQVGDQVLLAFNPIGDGTHRVTVWRTEGRYHHQFWIGSEAIEEKPTG